MRGLEKRVGHEERRPRITHARDLLGAGFAPYATRIDDWDTPAARLNGFWYSIDGANAPTATGTYIGISIGAGEGTIVQLASLHRANDAIPDQFQIRRGHAHASRQVSYSPWVLLGDSTFDGQTVLLRTGKPVPPGWYPCDGHIYVIAADPDTLSAAATVTTPNLPAPSGFTYIIRLTG